MAKRSVAQELAKAKRDAADTRAILKAVRKAEKEIAKRKDVQAILKAVRKAEKEIAKRKETS